MLRRFAALVSGALAGGAGAVATGAWDPFGGQAAGKASGGGLVLDVTDGELTALVPEAQRMQAYDGGADAYDDTVGWEEIGMGLLLLRRWLISSASGSVLEVAAGTGRNLPYYSASKVSSLLLTDASNPMLNVARAKADAHAELSPVYWSVGLEDLLGVLDAARETQTQTQTRVTVGDFALPTSFDTIVDTFGLCSYEEPVTALQGLTSLLADHDDARILLLEHGTAHYGWLNSYLDSRAIDHAAQWGCWFNRDIGAIIEQAGGLEVVSLRRFHFGTTWMVVLKKKKKKTSPVGL